MLSLLKNTWVTQRTTASFAASRLLDLAFPSRCMKCLREGSWLCTACKQSIRPFSQACIICEQESPRGITCTECSHDTLLAGVVSAGAYQASYIRRGISWLKYKGVQNVASVLGELMLPSLISIAPISELARTAVLVPIPLHNNRHHERGFNQAMEIAKNISLVTTIPVLELLSRPKATFRQAQLPSTLRKENMTNSFISTKEHIPRDRSFIILVDDVTTTGSTLSAAATALSVTDEQEIWGATVARG